MQDSRPDPEDERDYAYYGFGVQPPFQDYMRARVYPLNTARFAQIDPLFGGTLDPQNWNPYIYVGNNPCGFTDPTGMESDKKTPCEEARSDDACRLFCNTNPSGRGCPPPDKDDANYDAWCKNNSEKCKEAEKNNEDNNEGNNGSWACHKCYESHTLGCQNAESVLFNASESYMQGCKDFSDRRTPKRGLEQECYNKMMHDVEFMRAYSAAQNKFISNCSDAARISGCKSTCG